MNEETHSDAVEDQEEQNVEHLYEVLPGNPMIGPLETSEETSEYSGEKSKR